MKKRKKSFQGPLINDVRGLVPIEGGCQTILPLSLLGAGEANTLETYSRTFSGVQQQRKHFGPVISTKYLVVSHNAGSFFTGGKKM